MLGIFYFFRVSTIFSKYIFLAWAMTSKSREAVIPGKGAGATGTL